MELKDMTREELERELKYYKRLAKAYEKEIDYLKAKLDLISGGMVDALVAQLEAGRPLTLKIEEKG